MSSTALRHDESQLADPAWERQRWETLVAYQRFRTYRDLSATRSTTRVAEEYGVAAHAVQEMAIRNLWTERARRWDAHLDSIHRVSTEAEVRQAAAETARRVGQMQQTEWEIWEAAKDTVLDLLNQARAGDPKAAGAAAQLIREADRVARMSTGQPTEGSRPKTEDTGRQADLDAFLDSLAGVGSADEALEETK